MERATVMRNVLTISNGSTERPTATNGFPTRTTPTLVLEDTVPAALNWTSGRRTPSAPLSPTTPATSPVSIGAKESSVATTSRMTGTMGSATKTAATSTTGEWATELIMDPAATSRSIPQDP